MKDNPHSYVPDGYMGYECKRCGVEPTWPEADEPCPYHDSPLPEVRYRRRSWFARLVIRLAGCHP